MDFKALVTAQLNANNAETELKNLCKDRDVNLKVKIDDNEIKNLARKISKDKSFQVTAHLKDTSLKNIQHQLESMVKGMNIDLSKAFNVNSPTNPAKKYGQQVGNVISQSAEKAISNVSSKVIGNGFKVSKGMSDKVESEIESIVKDMTNGKGKVSKITINTKTSFNKKTLENVEELKSATVQYTNAAGEAITKTLQWERIGTDKSAKKGQKAVMGWRESTAKYTKSVEEASKAATNFENTQKKTANRLSNQTKQIYKSAIDPNASKTIKEQTHLDDLENRYKDINTEIGKLSGLTGSAFVDQENHINDLITDLKIVKKSYQDAESTATSLRSKPIDVVQDEVSKKVKGLEADIEKAGVSSQDLTDYITEMNKALKNPIDATGINDVLNTYSKASAELAKLKKEASAQQSLEKAQIKSNGLISEIEKAKVDNTGLENFKATINGVEVSANDLINSLNEVKTSGDVSVLSEQWKSFTSQAKQAGVMAEKAVDNAKKISSIKTDFSEGKYSADSKAMSAKLAQYVDSDKELVEKAKGYYKDYKDALSELELHFKGTKILSNNELVSTFEKMDTASSKFKNAMREIDIDVKPINTVLSKISDFDERFSAFKKNDISNFLNTTGYAQIESNLKEIETLQKRINSEKIKDNPNIDQINSDLKEMNSLLSKSETLYNNLSKPIGALDATLASNKTLNWLKENTKATKEFGDAFETLAQKQAQATTLGELQSYDKDYNNLVSQAKSMGLTGKSLWDESKRAFTQIAEFTGMYDVAQNLMQEIPMKMLQNVSNLDDSIIELQKVSDLGGTALDNFISKAYASSGEVARTGQEVIDATTTFKKAGYNLEESFDLSKTAMVMMNVGDGIDSVEEASSALIATLKGFNLDDSAAMDIVSMINETSNTAPIDFDNITEGLRRTSGTLSQAGTSIEETIGLITGGFAQLRDVEMVSTGLITISQRLRGIAEDGEELDPKLGEKFASIGVQIENTDGSLRSTYEIFQDYAKVYDNLTDKEKQYYAELAAGKLNVKTFNAIIQQWADVEQATNSALNSQGSAEIENEKVLQGLNARISAFKSAFENLSQSALDANFLGSIVDVGTGAIEILDSIIDRVGSLNTIIGVAGGILTTKSGSGKNVMPFSIRQNKIIAVLLT